MHIPALSARRLTGLTALACAVALAPAAALAAAAAPAAGPARPAGRLATLTAPPGSGRAGRARP